MELFIHMEGFSTFDDQNAQVTSNSKLHLEDFVAPFSNTLRLVAYIHHLRDWDIYKMFL